MTTRRKFLKHTALGSTMLLIKPSDLIQTYAPGTATGNGSSMPLSGNWHIKLDPDNKGIKQQWYKSRFTDPVQLPGSLQSQGLGNEVSPDTAWWNGKLNGVWATSPVYEKYRQPGNFKNYEFLQPKKHYLGAAWYAKEFTLPANWKNKRIVLFLERVHWQSTVYVNGREAGTQQYLGVPHEYDITDLLVKGKNALTIRVDNARIIDVGDMPHCISEQTQGTWNGIVGKIQLQATDKIWMDDVQVYPDIMGKKIKIVLSTGNSTGKHVNTTIAYSIAGIFEHAEKLNIPTGIARFEHTYSMGNDLQLWDEHHPHLYTLQVRLLSNELTVRFGMRSFGKQGTQFTINGTPTHLRGNVDCAIFPIHGYPETDLTWWKKIWQLYKDWGMNTVRFHSWCPPEAAFAAADEVGLYLQPECGDWSSIQTPEQFEFYVKESKAILKQYGNHPSFVTLAVGNEKNIKTVYLEQLFAQWKQDGRRVYSGKTGGKPLLDSCDFYAGGGTQNGVRARYYLGWPPQPGPSYFYQFAPSTDRDYTEGIKDDTRPFIAHEIAQRCAYPDVINLPAKFTGSLQPTYLDIARDQLKERGMLEQVPEFVQASGKWQVQMYKEEIEANLRTRGIGGFHLLSLQDFPGQGTAPVGMMDFFYDVKPYVTAADFRQFCHHTVLLARMKKRTWFSNELFHADMELYNFSGAAVHPSKTTCTIRSANGQIVHQKELDAQQYDSGSVHHVGNFQAGLESLATPAKYTFDVLMDGLRNSWDFWVYPQTLPAIAPTGIIVSDTLNEAVVAALDSGKTVLLLPARDQLKGKLVQCFGTFYWTAFDFHGGESSACGLLTDPRHPVFNHFPTDFHGNWQWWELLTQASPMILDDFEARHPWPKDYRPLIQMIPSWKVNRKLAVLLEAKVGKGKLMICSMDITNDLDRRRVAAQFRYSLICYMRSEAFEPKMGIGYDSIRELYAG